MPFRAQYLADIGLAVNPYPAGAALRVQSIYQTARKGRIAGSFAAALWVTHLQPVFVGVGAIPVAQPGFDNLIVTTALAIEATLAAAGRGGFGIAQKIVNLFMKDLWAFRLLPPAVEPLLHVPIDRGMLGKLRVIPATWNPWTSAVAGGPMAATVADYLGIQQAYRGHLAAPATPAASPPVFASVIEMEQFLWHLL